MVLSNISYPVPWVTLMKGQGIHRQLCRRHVWEGWCVDRSVAEDWPWCVAFQQVQLHPLDVVKIGRVRKLCRSVMHNIHIPETPWIMQNKPVLFDLLFVCASVRGEDWSVCVHARHLFQENVSGQGVGMVQAFPLSPEHTFTSLIKEVASANTCLRRTAFDMSCLEWRRGKTPPAGVAAVSSLQC